MRIQKRKLPTIVPPSFKIQEPKTHQYFIAVWVTRTLNDKFCFKVWFPLLSLGMKTARGSEVFKMAIAQERLLNTGLKKKKKKNKDRCRRYMIQPVQTGNNLWIEDRAQR